MTSILVGYGTSEGQTARVAERIADHLRERGHVVEVAELRSGGIEPGMYDAVVLGASIHLGKHQHRVVEFATRYSDALAARPSAFFQVCLSAAVEDETRRAEAEGYIDEFVESTGWRPDSIGSFAGALRYSEYGFVKRAMMKHIAADSTGDTDSSRDYEYTDWAAVERFADEFATLVGETTPVAGA